MDTLCQLGLAASALIVSLLSGEGEVLTNNTRSACGRALSVCSNLAQSLECVRGTFPVAIGLPGVGQAAGRRSGSGEISAPPKCGGGMWPRMATKRYSSGLTLTLLTTIALRGGE